MPRPSTAPTPSVRVSPSWKKKVRMSQGELNRLKSKYTNFKQGTNQYLYGVKLEKSVSESLYEDQTIPSQPTALKSKTLQGRLSPTTSKRLGQVPAIPTPTSPEVLTMTKTLLSRGGVGRAETGIRTAPIDLYDNQRVMIEKLKVMGGDISAKKKLVRVVKEKERFENLTMNVEDWEDHLPTYARRKIKKKEVGKKNSTEKILEEIRSGGRMMKGDECFEPKVHKSRCGLCQLFFHKSSMLGVISQKSVLELQSTWGVKHTGARFKAASFLYQKVKLCRFCSQMFDKQSRLARKFGRMHKHLDDAELGHHNTISDNIRMNRHREMKQMEEMKSRNLAVAGKAEQSSTTDGKLAKLAITGKVGAKGAGECTRTRREFESWWEVELDENYPIKSIVVWHRKDEGDTNRAYRATPYWIFVMDKKGGSNRLAECKRESICAAVVQGDDEKVVWKMRPNLVGRVVRIQVEGVKSLQLAGVEVIKGGLDATILLEDTQNPTPTNPNQPQATTTTNTNSSSTNKMKTTTFTFDFLGTRPRRPTMAVSPKHGNHLSSTNGSSGRPNTAPAQTLRRSLSRPAKPHKSLLDSTKAVEALFNSTDTMYNTRQNLSTAESNILSRYTSVEIEAIQRNFLHFAKVPDIPRHSHKTAAFKIMLADLCEDTEIDPNSTLKAIKGLKSAGAMGPRGRKKEVFGFWEKEDINTDFSPSVSLATGADSTVDAPTPTAQTPASDAYTALVESYVIDDLDDALDDVEYAREVLKLGPMRITFFEFLRIVVACQERNLPSIGKIFNVPTNMVATKKGSNSNNFYAHKLSPRPSTTGSTARGRHSRRSEDMPPVLTLSQSLKFYDNPEATFSSSPAPMRKPKIKNTGKTRLQKSEEEYQSLLEKIETFEEPKLTGFEYVNEIDARKERMRELHKRVAVTPKIHPALNRKNCSLCLLSFPLDALVESVTVKCLKELSKSWGVTFQKLGLGVSDSAILMQHRVPVCAFCSQFFDPDAFSGLSKSRRKKRAKFTQHFDDAYPDTYSKPKIKEEDDENVKRSRKASMAFVKNKLAEWEDMGITDSEKFKFDNSEDIRLGDQMEHSKNRNVNLKGTDTAIHAVDSLEHSLESFQHSKNAIYSPNASPEHEHSVRPATAPTHPTFDNTPPFESLTTNMNAFDNESLSLVSGDPEHGDAKQHKVYHSDKKELVKEEQDFVDEYTMLYDEQHKEKRNVGTVREVGGRKDASTGISVFEFSSKHAAESQAKRMQRGLSIMDDPNKVAQEEKEHYDKIMSENNSQITGDSIEEGDDEDEEEKKK